MARLWATTLEANAALRSSVRRDTGESYQDFLTKLAQASGIETPTRADLARMDRKRKNKGSNDDRNLRNAHLAVVDRGKVVDYLLNEAHPDNGGKARFFLMLGFSRDDPERLMQALRTVVEHGKVVTRHESMHGEKYVVDGWLSVHTQKSRPWSVRTVWIIEHSGGFAAARNRISR
jgi:hypothetical protein